MRPLALVAILPAALGMALPAPVRAITVPLCTADGAARTLPLPQRPELPKPGDERCLKGCHAGPSRKRGVCG